MEEIRVFGVFEQLDSRIDHFLTANTPPELFNLVFTRLQEDFAPRTGTLGKLVSLATLWVCYGYPEEV